MKKILMVLLLSLVAAKSFAEMRYNPINNLLYTHPERPGINQDEYRLLILHCIQLERRLIAMNGNVQVPREKVIDQCGFYLESVGTISALRLLDDIKKNKIYYANGTFMKVIF